MVLFIDLKKAYDSVDHELLFIKLNNKGFDVNIVNTIKKLYSNAFIQVGPLSDRMNVNRGVLQGSLISPLLFNIYIDDLVVELKKKSFDVLAYADDIAVICDKNQLDQCIDVLDKWSTVNKIDINRKKSGILVFGPTPPLTEDSRYRDYPIVRSYRYLGIWVNDNLNFSLQVARSGDKLRAYCARNKRLIRSYFSPRSLIKIFNYYQKSRLVYGMSSDLIQGSTMINLRKSIIGLIKDIVGIAKNTNNLRVVLTLAIPDLVSKLVIQLIKNLAKYQRFFGRNTSIYDEAIMKVIGKEWFDKWKRDKLDLAELQVALDRRDMSLYASGLGIEV